jgi:hypothetical protein
MRQSTSTGGSDYSGLLQRVVDDIDAIVHVVAHDVSGPGDDLELVASGVRPAVERIAAALAAGPKLSDEDIAAIRSEGAAEARRGATVGIVIDRYLSTGWAIWEAAVRLAPEPASLASLGAALLRAGDAAAAAVAEGHGEAQRELASRAAAARQAFVDELLDLDPADRDAMARLDRRAASLGVPRTASWQPYVVDVGRELEDGGPEAARVERALTRPERTGGVAAQPVVAIRRGRLVVLVPGDRDRGDIAAIAGDLASDRPPTVLRGRRVDVLERVGLAVADAMAALDVAIRVRSTVRGGRRPDAVVLDETDVALELAILADRHRLAAAVEHELGPLLDAPRAGTRLVETFRAWLDHRQNLQATARALGIAPRTVAYRLERVERLAGRPLDGPAVRRLATAVFAADLLDSGP